MNIEAIALLGLLGDIAVWLLISYVLMSLIEWAIHAGPMHSRRWVRRYRVGDGVFERHAVLHHGRWFKNFDSEYDVAAKHISFVLNPIENLLGLSPVVVLLWFLDPVGAIVFGCFVAAHAALWTVLHSEMHRPKGRFFSRLRLYKFLRNYHKTHHDCPAANFNIVCLGADFVFGTYRRTNEDS